MLKHWTFKSHFDIQLFKIKIQLRLNYNSKDRVCVHRAELANPAQTIDQNERDGENLGAKIFQPSID